MDGLLAGALNCGFLNIDSIGAKKPEINHILKQNDLGLLGLAETKTKEHYCPFFTVNYDCAHNNRNQHGGGTAIISKKDTVTPSPYELPVTIPEYKERLTAVEIQNLVFVTLYAPCESDRTESRRFYNELKTLIEPIKDRVILMGDFNAQLVGYGSNQHSNTNGELLTELITDLQLEVINDPLEDTLRHKSWKTTFCVDYVLASYCIADNISDFCVEHTEFSDHKILLYRYNFPELNPFIDNRTRYNISRLQEKSEKEAYQQCLRLYT